MKNIFEFTQVYLHRLPVDGRKAINGLSVIVQEAMKHDPFGSGLFAFTNRRRNQIRLLYWDRTGFAMWSKRLEEEKFRWPTKVNTDVVTLSAQQLSWMLDGLDISRMKPHDSLKFSVVS